MRGRGNVVLGLSLGVLRAHHGSLSRLSVRSSRLRRTRFGRTRFRALRRLAGLGPWRRLAPCGSSRADNPGA